MKPHNDCILYAVSWDADRIVKLGFTDHISRRRKSFAGARLILTLAFPDFTAGYDFEIALHREAYRAWPRAFARREDAVTYLGGKGQGFYECYTATADDALNLIASQCADTLERHSTTSHCDVTVRRHGLTDGRTDGLTKKHRDGQTKSCSFVTRTRVRRDFNFGLLAAS